MGMSHDTMKKRNISAIYSRKAYAAPLEYWPEYGFAVPCIDGAYIANHSDHDIYVCGVDGVIYKVNKLASDDINGLLTQLYLALGVNLDAERMKAERVSASNPGRAVFYSIEPNTKCVPKDTYVKTGQPRLFEPSWYYTGATPVNFLDERSVTPVPSNSADAYKIRARNELIAAANMADDHHGITMRLRNGVKGVTVFKPYNVERLRYGDGYNMVARAQTISHHQATAYFENTFQIYDQSEKYQEDGSYLVKKGNPIVAWNAYPENLIRSANNGFYIPEYGLTLGLSGAVMNKHFSLYDPGSHNYIAKSGIRFIVPRHATRTARIFVRLGEYIQELMPTLETEGFVDEIVAFVTDPNGDEVRVGAALVDHVMEAGLKVTLPDNTSWTIPFFESRHAAVSWTDPVHQAALDSRDKEIQTMRAELTKYRLAEEKRQAEKQKTILQYLASFFTHKAVIGGLTSMVIAAMMTAIGYFTGKNKQESGIV